MIIKYITFLSLFCFLIFAKNVIAQTSNVYKNTTDIKVLDTINNVIDSVLNVEYNEIKNDTSCFKINRPIRVYISFFVETNGTITNIKVIKNDCYECNDGQKKSYNDEAIKVVSEMPDWEPIRKRQKYILPMKFIIGKN